MIALRIVKPIAKTVAILSTLQVAAGSRSTHSLPDLPYDYNSLEPVISAEIM